MSEETFFAHFRYAIPVALTAASLQLYNVPRTNYIPSQNYDIPNFQLSNYSWEDDYIPSKADFVSSQLGVESIKTFAFNLMNEMIDIPPEFSQVIDENFWDLF